MRRPRFTLRLLFATILGIAGVLGVLTATRERVANRSNYNQIQLGMSRSEVETLLGDNPIELAPLDFEDVTFVESPEDLLFKYPPPHTLHNWKGETYMISIILDRDGRVGAKYYQRTPNASIIDRLADWFGI